jgi:hypothetical protein
MILLISIMVLLVLISAILFPANSIAQHIRVTNNTGPGQFSDSVKNQSFLNQTKANFSKSPTLNANVTFSRHPATASSNQSFVSACCTLLTHETGTQLEGIKNSINDIRKSFDSSTIFSNIGLAIGLFSIAVAIFIPFLYEKLKEPKLELQKVDESTPQGFPALSTPSPPSAPSSNTPVPPASKYLHGRVLNAPHKKWLGRWFGIERNPAVNTRVIMEFYEGDGEKLLINKIYAKWGSAPEPLTPQRDDFDSSKLALLYRETILSDEEGEQFDIAVKHEGETQCYAMTGETYQMGLDSRILHNTLFSINRQKFRVSVHAISGIHYSKPKTFVIENPGTSLDQFRISAIEN